MTAAKLPLWRGFNLLEKFTHHHNAPFRESDFAWIAEWGFNFVRLPMSYWCWAKPEPERWLEFDEASLADVDEAVDFGARYGIHVNLNLHRAPGYCVNPPPEPLDLWTDERALDAACGHWAHLAGRYKGIPNEKVSFDLLNEPANTTVERYVKVHTALVAAIRAVDPDRLIIADGLQWGNQPVPEMAGLGVAQSTRGYQPMQISHYQASWVDSGGWAEPTWPLELGDGDTWDRERLKRQCIEPWQALETLGVGVHVGEWGAFQHTPHAVVLAWMETFLGLWREAGWGWSMWNFRGSFGILDSNRTDIEYEDYRGCKLDRAMLELILRY